MKDSKIEWVGEIPENWEVIKIKYILASNDGGVWGNDPEDTDDDKTVLRSTEQTIDGKWSIVSPARRCLKGVCLKNYVIKPNDLLMTKSSGSGLHIGKTTLAGQYFFNHECYYSNFLQRLRGIDRIVYPKFLWYILNSVFVREQFVYMQNSTSGIGNINTGNIENVIIPISLLTEQKEIAEYLDEKCGEIDALLADIKDEIETLEQYKRSVITESVTKGLNPSAPMKNSGIEWVGEIPEHWEVSKLKYLFSTVSGNGFNINLQGEENGDYPFCKASDISLAHKDLNKAQNYVTKQIAILNRYNIIPKGSIIFAKIGEAMKKNNRAICQCDCCIDNNCQALIPSSKICAIFAYYILRCINMQWFDNAGTIPCISVRKMMDCTIPLPSFLEQQEIAEFLDKKCAEIDAIISDKQTEIQTLESYKKSLIYEYVTGKKEVKRDVSGD